MQLMNLMDSMQDNGLINTCIFPFFALDIRTLDYLSMLQTLLSLYLVIAITLVH